MAEDGVNGKMFEPIKHPLEHNWCLWYFKNEKGKDWESNLKQIHSFDTAEDFWALYNHIKAPSELDLGTDYYLFKKGIMPMWEDPANRKGGRWLVCVEKKHGVQRWHKTDDYWLNLILLSIGENFGPHNEYLCGLAVNVRPKMDKIGIWLSNCAKYAESGVLHIGQTIKSELNFPKEHMIHFQTHQESAAKASLNHSMYKL